MNAIGDPDDFYTLHHGARRHITTGIVIHSTRGGAPTPAQEFDGTLNWFARSSSKVSAHAVISLEGLVAWVLPHQYAAYHAKSYNRTHLGVELVQQTPDTPFSDAQYLALAELISHWRSIYGELELIGHDQVDPQKSDPGRLFDWAKLAFLLAPVIGGRTMPELTPDIANALDVVRGWSNPDNPGSLWGTKCQLDQLQHYPEATILENALQQLQDASRVLDRAFGVGR